MAVGKKVEKYARKIFPKGILIDHSQPFSEVLAQSQEAIKRVISNTPIYNALLTADNLVAETDILLPVENNEWDLYEVKSSVEVKKEYIPDIAFQKYVADQAELKIHGLNVVTINTEFIKTENPSEYTPEEIKQLFSINNISDAADFSLIKQNIEIAKQVIELKEPARENIGEECNDCPLKPDCWRDILAIENNIFTLHRLGKRAFGWYEDGIVKITEIPDDYLKTLTDKQKIQVQAETIGEVYINRAEIGRFLRQLEYPLYFLDFETVNPALPIINNSHPFEQIPFQFSCHVVDALNAEPEHHSWIWDKEDDADPRREMLKRLKPLLKDEGSIIAYHASFERGILKRAVEICPEYQEWLSGISDRIVDLAIPFRNFWVYHPEQHGRWSLKSVLPALTEHNYETLQISEGEQAGREYLRILEGQVKGSDKKAILEGLEKYCGLDTEGLIWILQKLRKRI